MRAVICVVNQKGGVGKSTIAINLAIMASKAGYKTILIDGDPQGSSTQFYEIREDGNKGTFSFSCISVVTPTLQKVLPSLDYEICIIDGAGKNDKTESNSMRHSDFILIPVQPSNLDIWASAPTFEKYSSLVEFAPEKKGFVVYNQCNPLVITKLEKEIREHEGEIKEQYSVGFLRSKLNSREIYKKSTYEGIGVVEADNAKAKDEIVSLFNEIMEEIDVNS